jgi:hypothetical protein
LSLLAGFKDDTLRMRSAHLFTNGLMDTTVSSGNANVNASAKRAPADSPKRVIRSGSPPSAAMFVCTQLMAASRSRIPKFPGPLASCGAVGALNLKMFVLHSVRHSRVVDLSSSYLPVVETDDNNIVVVSHKVLAVVDIDTTLESGSS